MEAVGKRIGVKVSYGDGSAKGREIEIGCPPNDQFAIALAKLLHRVHPVKLSESPDNTHLIVYLPEKGG